MIFNVVGLFILLYAFVDYRKSFLMFLIFKMVLTGNILFLSLPGIPSLTMDLFMILFYLVMYYFLRKKKEYSNQQFPLKLPFALILLSMCLSAYFSLAGLEIVATRTFSDYVTQYVFIIFIWKIVDNEKDYEFLIKGITVIVLFSAIYGMFEYVIQSNPLMEYEMSLVDDPDAVREMSYITDKIRGYRVQSIFESAIGAGINWGLYVIWMFTLVIVYRYTLPWRKLVYTSILLSGVAIFLVKSRSPIIFLLVGSLCFVNFKSKKFVRIFILGLVMTILLIPFVTQDISNVVLSMFDSSYQKEVSGSSWDLRFRTLEACWDVAKQSVIFGVGIKFMSLLTDKTLIFELHGLESVWFVSVVYYGMFGVLTQMILAYYSIKKIPKKYNSKSARWLAVAYWITYTITTLPGMLVYLYYIIYFYYLKKDSMDNQYPRIIVCSDKM